MDSPCENLMRLFRREGYDSIPIQFDLCPHLENVYRDKTGSELPYQDYFGFPMREVELPAIPEQKQVDWPQFYTIGLKEGVEFDDWGIAYEPGSEAAYHMTRMRHPMVAFKNVKQMQDYPFPDFSEVPIEEMKNRVMKYHQKGLAVYGFMEFTIWEIGWYLRGMNQLMMDMALDDEKAYWLLDKTTDLACIRARKFAACDVDVLRFGDDVGMQSRLLMSEDFYRKFLKPRLGRVIRAAKEVKPNIIIHYHSCGYVTPLIPDLMEVGVEVLNPLQPECMDFKEMHELYGDRLSFSGTLGTQTTLPFGTPKEVRETVFRNLNIAGDNGGLLCCPTHLLEPDVPWDNIIAYVDACKEYDH